MRITNFGNLPEALVQAVTNDPYTRGGSDYSTTQLSKPSRIIALEAKHRDEMEEDVADRIYSLIGQLGHSILERAGTADIVEKRLYAEISGKTLSGQVDLVDKSELIDYKFCSYHTSKDGVKDDWIAQASVNRWLCSMNGIEIEKSTYVAVYRDWSKPMAARKSDYPQQQVEAFDVPMWSLEETEQWIKDRIASHESAKAGNLPMCSKEERWATDEKVAVMLKGKKRAKKLCDSTEDAMAYVMDNDLQDYRFEPRPAEDKRCLYYCPVKKHCSYWLTNYAQ